MSRGLPSMTALLGLLAIAGYQNRDKIAEMLGGLGQGGASPAPGHGAGTSSLPGQADAQGGGLGGGLGGLLGGLGGAGGAGGAGGLGGLLSGLGGAGAGGLLNGGLSDLLEQFRQNGQGDVAESCGATGSEQTCRPTTARDGDRAGCARHAGSADGALPRGHPVASFAGTARRRGQVHPGRPAPGLSAGPSSRRLNDPG